MTAIPAHQRTISKKDEELIHGVILEELPWGLDCLRGPWDRGVTDMGRLAILFLGFSLFSCGGRYGGAVNHMQVRSYGKLCNVMLVEAKMPHAGRKSEDVVVAFVDGGDWNEIVFFPRTTELGTETYEEQLKESVMYMTNTMGLDVGISYRPRGAPGFTAGLNSEGLLVVSTLDVRNDYDWIYWIYVLEDGKISKKYHRDDYWPLGPFGLPPNQRQDLSEEDAGD